MDCKNHGYLLGGAILWAVGLLLLVEAIRDQWIGGMSLMVFVYYLVALLILSLGWSHCCTKFLCCAAPKK